MNPFRSAGILGSLVWVGIATLAGCSDAAQEASDNTAPQAQQVTLSTASRPAHVGAVLQGSYQYADPDGDGEGGTLKAWLRDGQPIEGANQDNYTATAQDSGKNLQYRVTPAAATGQSPGAAAVSSGITIENSAPVVTLSTSLVGAASPFTTGIGSVLRVDFSYSDVDGDTAATAEIRWLRDGVAILNATSPSYTVTFEDLGFPIVAEVTPLALQGVLRGTAVTSKSVTIINSIPVAQNVVLIASATPAIVGSVLTASYTYFDADNDPEDGSPIQWLRNGVAVGGATARTYTLTPADAGASFRFTVTPKSSPGTSPGVTITSNTLTAGNSAPQASNVVVNGGATSSVVGATLSANYTYSDLDLNPEGASVYRWYRDSSIIPGATARNYTVMPADSGADLSFEVTPVDSSASRGIAVRSNVIRVNNSAPVAQNVTLAPLTAGPPVVGSTLAGSYTYYDADGDAQATSSFRWLSNGVVIAGAQSLNYILVSADAGKTIVFEVTPKAANGVPAGSPTLSNGLGINNSAPTASNVVITPGTAQVTTLLTASFTYNDTDNDPQGTSIYEWRNGGTTVIGTGTTYTVAANDAHKILTVKVTPVASTGTSPGLPVTSPGITIGNSPPSVTGVTISSSVGGSVYTGVVLTANYVFADPDGDGEGASTYQWLRNGNTIGGATALAYTVTGADIGQPLTVQVTPKDNFVPPLAGTPVTSSAITPVNLAPVASNVVVNGKAVNQPGEVLNVT